MIGIAVVLGTITLCYANVDVENELMEIRTILIRQEKEIKALRNENRVLRAAVKKMAVEIDNLKNTDRISRAQVALKAEIERPRKRLSQNQLAQLLFTPIYLQMNQIQVFIMLSFLMRSKQM